VSLIERRGTDLTALRKMADDVESQGFRATAGLYRQMAEEIEALHAQLRGAVEDADNLRAVIADALGYLQHDEPDAAAVVLETLTSTTTGGQ
jgi:hypothetical protein